MIMIQFREDVHKENMSLLHNIKQDIKKLCENLEKEEEANFGERRYIIDQFDRREPGMEMDERRGGGRSGMRGGRSGYRQGGGSMGQRERYPEYPFEEMGGGRYDY